MKNKNSRQNPINSIQTKTDMVKMRQNREKTQPTKRKIWKNTTGF